MPVRRSLGRPALALLLLATVLAPTWSWSAPPRAEIPRGAYAEVNAALVENHVLPRYRALAKATGALASATSDLCESPSAEGLKAARAAYHGAMDAWMGIQHIGFGPVELFMRAYRFYFWPQSRGKVGPAVEAELEGGAPKSAETLARASVAVQGLPAVEYLLFEHGGTLADGEPDSRPRCALLKAVTANMRGMAAGIVADWTGGEIQFAEKMAAPGPDNPYFRTHRQATLAVFKSLHDALHMIADVKLRPVLGREGEAGDPALAESRRSGRALRNIVVGIEALRALYTGGDATGLSKLVTDQAGDEALDALMRRAFAQTLATARGVEQPVVEALDNPAAREKLDMLHLQVRALKQIVATRLAKALDLSVGFNALDGD